MRPLERRVDSVLRVKPADGERFLLAIEAQGRRDTTKAVNWAYYVAYLAAKHQCPVLLLVICQDKATANWAAGPFPLGTPEWAALSLHPLVVGPGNVPVILDEEEASRDLTMAAFSALTHGRDGDATAILDVLARALGRADQATLEYFADLLEVGLGDTRAGRTWRTLMTMAIYFPGRRTLREESYLEGKAEGVTEGVVAGRAEGVAVAVLRVLERRGVSVSEGVRSRVTGCADPELLDLWLDRAFAVAAAEEIFLDEE
ncbi:hypothetical protein [Streptomyces sp. XM4193]|uniref:hypothetical protein n=1 Tax=Streptomyces sp. XM4193 TaxID=2929782 RepID=UPI0027E2F487|nr:hypothetical protein [Streptomyces sp. XM4193]